MTVPINLPPKILAVKRLEINCSVNEPGEQSRPFLEPVLDPDMSGYKLPWVGGRLCSGRARF